MKSVEGFITKENVEVLAKYIELCKTKYVPVLIEEQPGTEDLHVMVEFSIKEDK